MLLNKEDWQTLDNLLSKIGFGGYYDTVEILKMSIINLKPHAKEIIKDENDLHILINLLYQCTNPKPS